MPVYEFTCRDCAKDFEELVRADERVACPSCASRRVEKRFSTFATQGGGSATNAPFAGDMPGGCGTCGDPRGPGACARE